MSAELGIIENAEMLDGAFVVTGHQWVALAFEQDEPYVVTRFEGLKGELSAKEIAAVNDASEVFDFQITPLEVGFSIRFLIWDQIEVVFECAELTTSHRYYSPVELERIFQNIGHVSPEILQGYISEIESHGIEITITDGKHRFSKR